MWGPLLFAVGLTAAGLHLWRLAWRYLRLRRAMRSWPRVPAQILGDRTVLGACSRRVAVEQQACCFDRKRTALPLEMTSREFTARAGLQIALESNCPLLVRKLNDDMNRSKPNA